MMLDISFKLIISLIILLIALFGGLFPVLIRTNDRTRRWLIYGEIFADGVFLGAGLIHLLPDAEKTFTSIVKNEYPLMFAVCAFSILALRIIEEGTIKLFNQHPHLSDQTWLAYLLAILLSVHSVLAGAALGLETTLATFMIIFIAIIAHKGAAAFALGVNFRKSALPQSTMIKLMILFSIMTPVGVIFGSIISATLQATPGHIAEAIFNAIAAGTFIYIGAFHSVKMDCDHCEPGFISTRLKLLSFTVGLTFMAVIAIWL